MTAINSQGLHKLYVNAMTEITRQKLVNLLEEHTIILSVPGEIVWVSCDVKEHRANMRLLTRIAPTPPEPEDTTPPDT